METKPNPLRVTAAYGVHFFTATGAVWGLLAILAIFEGDYRMMIVWMIVAMLVDILDYLNYVLVPAVFIIKADIVPEPVRLPTACLILLTSAYQFTQTDAKTADHHFKGFPSYWNVAALYMLLMGLPEWVNFAFLMLFNVLVFVPIKYIYPSRNSYLRLLTLALTYLYGAIGIWGLLQYPNHPQWFLWVSFLYVAYYIGLSLLPKKNVHAN
jgi:phosphatidylcholine synthase